MATAPKTIVLIGAPGSGKGTQAPNIVREFVVHSLETFVVAPAELTRCTLRIAGLPFFFLATDTATLRLAICCVLLWRPARKLFVVFLLLPLPVTLMACRLLGDFFLLLLLLFPGCLPPQGKAAKAVMEAGKLVSDDIILGLIEENIHSPACAKGQILDGFPRTVGQAQALDALLARQNRAVANVIGINVPTGILLDRICGRLVHKASGRSYHVAFAPPKVPGKDDITGEPLIQRADDNEKTVSKRLQVFETETKPVKAYYQAKGLLREIDGDRPPASVYADIQAVLGAPTAL